MIKDGKKIAKHYLSLGLNPVPVNVENKEPVREGWSSSVMTEDQIDQYTFEAIGINTGINSQGLEAIDFDLKNAEKPEEFMKTFKSKVPKSLLKRLVIQQTVSGGLHMIYRCEDISSSKKLAKNPKGEAVIETRGEGGYIKVYPSEGYKLLQGSFDKIPIITPEERLQLFISAKMLNALVVKEANKRRSHEENEYLKKFPEYNNSIKIGIDLLEKHGWTIHSEDDIWINYSRPETQSGDLHAGYHKEGRFFWVFSTAQDTFEQEKAYNNHAIFAELECNGDYRKAYAKLYELGYGDEKEVIRTITQAEQDDWDEQIESLSFLSDEVEENSYLEQAREGEILQGKVTGWDELDKYMRIKDNSLNFGLGLDGVGKSVFTNSLAVASNVLHDIKWGMIMPENKTAMSRRRLVEAHSGRPIGSFKNNEILFKKYLEHSRENFKIISNKKHYSLYDVLEMGKRLYEYYGIGALLIDPYNFFKVEGNAYGHNNDILSKMRVFAEQYCSIWTMAHPSSNAPRTGKSNDGFLKAPTKYDIQGGADFPYRVDDFFVMHRVTNHPDPDYRRTMQIIMEKVKEQETGGQVHNSGEWTELIWETRDGFTGYWDTEGNNPIYKAQMSKLGVRAQTKRIDPKDAF